MNLKIMRSGMAILRAKTIDLFKHAGLTEAQRKNSEEDLDEIQTGSLRLNSYPRSCKQ